MKTKERFITMMLALMAMFMGTTVMAKVAYAVYENSTNTLTFYFDNNMRSRQGVGRDVEGLYSDGDPWWLGKTIKKVVFTDDFSNAKPKTTLNWFAYQGSLTEIEGIANLNTSNVTNMSRMFMYCTSLEDLDLHTFSTGSVTDMSNMFCKCSGMKSLNINNFDTSSVTDMSNMFDGCCQLETIGFSASSFTTGNVTNMYAMFNNCSSLKSLDVSSFNTSQVTNMSYMFNGCSGLSSLYFGDNFITVNVTDMSNMFSGCSSLERLNFGDNFITVNVTDMRNMFSDCRSMTVLNLSSFDTGNVESMRNMYRNCDGLRMIFVGDNWSTTKVEDVTEMFYGCTNLEGYAGTTYSDWEEYANDNAYTLYFARVDGGGNHVGFLSVRPAGYAVYSSNTLTFYNDGQMTGKTGEYLLTIDELPAWHEHCNDIQKVVFDNSFATARPVSTSEWFNWCSNLTVIEGMENLNTSKVLFMNGMFNYCMSLASIDLSHFDTSNVIGMSAMFLSCISLTTLDLSSFNTSHVRNMSTMFYNCSNLVTIYVGANWSTECVTESSLMFDFCRAIEGEKGTVYYGDNAFDTYTAAYAHIDGGENNPGYFSSATQGTISTNINEAYGQRESVKGQRDERYNLSGQRVGKDYKGIVIINGKKTVVK
ncbi:MAG: BspA family leucine-rich repeat surface protein [Prevotella sp.]|nr:BspA family leucine-rich repeat surface protein [Prevotella sp.]